MSHPLCNRHVVLFTKKDMVRELLLGIDIEMVAALPDDQIESAAQKCVKVAWRVADFHYAELDRRWNEIPCDDPRVTGEDDATPHPLADTKTEGNA